MINRVATIATVNSSSTEGWDFFQSTSLFLMTKLKSKYYGMYKLPKQ